MNLQSSRRIKIIEREIELTTKLYNKAIENGPLDEKDQEIYDKFLEFKNESIARIKEQDVIDGHITQLANDVSDLRLQQRVSDSALIKRSEQYYNNLTWDADVLQELQQYYQRMELAHREGDVFLFGSYVMRQVEAVANYQIVKRIGLGVVTNDMLTLLTSAKGASKPLYEWIITGNSLKSKKARQNLASQAGYTVSLDDLELMVKIKYLFWACKEKGNGKPPYLPFDPFNYLTTARNKASHGYFTPSTLDESDRHQNMLDNPAVYFLQFYSILHDLRSCLI